MESMPLEACHLPALLFVSSHALSPKIALLVGIYLPLPRPTLDQDVELLLHHLPAHHVHNLAPLAGRTQMFAVVDKKENFSSHPSLPGRTPGWVCRPHNTLQKQ